MLRHLEGSSRPNPGRAASQPSQVTCLGWAGRGLEGGGRPRLCGWGQSAEGARLCARRLRWPLVT